MKVRCVKCGWELVIAGPSRGTGRLGTSAVRLTPRQAQILSLLERDLNQKDIARTLGLAPKTVENHMEILFKKMGLHTAPAALARAIRLELL